MVKRHFGRCFLGGALVSLMRALSKRHRYFPSKGTPTACPTMARNCPTVAVAWCSWKTLRNSSSTRFSFCLRPPECKQCSAIAARIFKEQFCSVPPLADLEIRIEPVSDTGPSWTILVTRLAQRSSRLAHCGPQCDLVAASHSRLARARDFEIRAQAYRKVVR